MHACLHTYIHTYTQAYMHACIHNYQHTCMHRTHTYEHLRIHLHARTRPHTTLSFLLILTIGHSRPPPLSLPSCLPLSLPSGLPRARAQPPNTWRDHPDWNRCHGPGLCTCCTDEFPAAAGSKRGSRRSGSVVSGASSVMSGE
jgi:hypothetical protein